MTERSLDQENTATTTTTKPVVDAQPGANGHDHLHALILERGFQAKHIPLLTAHQDHLGGPTLSWLTETQIQESWLHRFPAMRDQPGGALLLRFNQHTVSLRPETPPVITEEIDGEERTRTAKYLYGANRNGDSIGSNTQPWIPPADLGKPLVATEGLWDALVCTHLIGIPCCAITAPSHLRHSNLPKSVRVYISDSDVPFHHSPSLLPVVVGQAKSKRLKLAHLPRNPDADYAYTTLKIPDDCKWGMEEWFKAWSVQGLDPKEQLQLVIDQAQLPVAYLGQTFARDYGAAGICYPDNATAITNACKAIADATCSFDADGPVLDLLRAGVLIDLLRARTKLKSKLAKQLFDQRCHSKAVTAAKEREQRIATGLEEPPPPPAPPPPPNPYEVKNRTPGDVHFAEMVLAGDTLYGSARRRLFRYETTRGYWLRVIRDELELMASLELRKMFAFDRNGELETPFGSDSQTKSAVNKLMTLAYKPSLGEQATVITFQDCSFNCSTEQRVPHSPDHATTYAIDAPLTLSDQCPETFANAIEFCYGDEAMPIVRAWIRAIIDPTMPYGKFLLIIGAPGTGKGTFLEFTEKLLPHDCRSSLTEPGILASPDKVYQFVLNKRYIVFPDLPPTLGVLQQFFPLVDNADVSVRKLHDSETDTITPNCRFAAAATKFPSTRDGDRGITRRALVLQTRPRSGHTIADLKGSIVGDTPDHLQLRAQVIGWALSLPREEAIDLLVGELGAELTADGLEAFEVESDAVAQFIDQALIPFYEPSDDKGGPQQLTLSDQAPQAPATKVPAALPIKSWDTLYPAYRAFCGARGFVGVLSLPSFVGAVRSKLPDLCPSTRARETTEEAKADGRTTRRSKPRVDYGFQLRPGLVATKVLVDNGGDIGISVSVLQSGGFAALRQLKAPE